MNPYLIKLREKYTAMQASTSGIQTRASEEDRPLSPEELAAIKAQGEEMRALLDEIQVLSNEEERNLRFARAANALNAGMPDENGAGDVRASGFGGIRLGASTKPRDPGHYRAGTDGGQNSFYGDMMRVALLQDAAAKARLDEHNTFMRAETTTSIAGVVPPKWLTEEYTTRAQEGRVLAAAVRNVPLSDARPFTLPGQTANTTVTTQSAENDALTDSDAYAATGVTVTPITIVGRDTVSRQLLDASTPAIDQLILADLTASYNANIENRIGTAIRAAGTTTTVALADFIDPTDPLWGPNSLADVIMSLRKVRFMRPTHFTADYELFTELLKLKDTTGRPLVNTMGDGQNSIGNASVNADGYVLGVPLLVSEGMNNPANTDESGAAIVASDIILFESPQMSFKYEEVAGPQSIQLGLWKYAAIAVRQGTRSVRNLVVDITP